MVTTPLAESTTAISGGGLLLRNHINEVMKRRATNAVSLWHIGADNDYAQSGPHSTERHVVSGMADTDEHIAPGALGSRMRITAIRRNVQHRQIADSDGSCLLQNQRYGFSRTPNAA